MSGDAVSFGPRGFGGITADGFQQRYVIVGQGSPSNVVSGDPGSIYLDSVAGTFYVKTSGFAETNWTAGIVGGAISGTTGTFSGAVSMTALTATTGTFSGAVTALASTALKVAAYPVVAADSSTTFQNTGAIAQVNYTLPAATAGRKYTFLNTAAGATFTLITAVTPDKISSNGVQGATAGSLVSTQIWSSITVLCPTAGIWQVIDANGIWTLA